MYHVIPYFSAGSNAGYLYSVQRLLPKQNTLIFLGSVARFAAQPTLTKTSLNVACPIRVPNGWIGLWCGGVRGHLIWTIVVPCRRQIFSERWHRKHKTLNRQQTLQQCADFLCIVDDV